VDNLWITQKGGLFTSSFSLGFLLALRLARKPRKANTRSFKDKSQALTNVSWLKRYYEFPRENLHYFDPDDVDVEFLSGLTDCDVYIDEGQWIFDSYENINFFIKRTKPYQTYGRNQTEEQAKEIDKNLLTLIDDWGYLSINGDSDAKLEILKELGIK